jgi:hypothetical protein
MLTTMAVNITRSVLTAFGGIYPGETVYPTQAKLRSYPQFSGIAICDCPPTFYVLHPLLQVFPDTVGVVIPPGVAGPEVENAAVGVDAPLGVAGPGADVVAVGVVEPGVVFVVPSVADVAEPQASVDIAPAFAVLVPVSVVAVEVDSSGRPRFFAFPNIDYYSSSSSSVEVVC